MTEQDTQAEATEGATLAEVLAPGWLPAEDMVKAAKARIDDELAAARADRQVSTKEDTYPLLRQIGGLSDALGEYERGIREVRRYLDQAAEEEVIEGHAEDDAAMVTERWNGAGVPAANAYVPTPDGRLIFERQFDYSSEVDWTQIVGIVAGKVTAGAHHQLRGEERLEFAVQVGSSLMAWLGELAKVEPRATGFKARAEALSAAGDDRTASIVRGALRSMRKYRGLKVKRDGGKGTGRAK